MASFQAKIVWKRPRKRENKMRKRENKNKNFVPSLPDAKFKIPKKLQKYLKKIKVPVWLHLKPPQVEGG